jgi:hypothetical protein
MCDASGTNDVVDPSTKKSLNLANLTRDELIQLIQSGINEHRKFVSLVSTAISNAHSRVHLTSLKPLPYVDHDALRRKFHRKLHSLDHSDDFQQDDVWELESALDDIIFDVESSVNKTSDLDTIEDAFVCLKHFVDEMFTVFRSLYEHLAQNQGHVLHSISDSMVEVGALLREKGGPTDKVNSIKWRIVGWANGDELDGDEFIFPQVFEAVWGDAEKETKVSNEKKGEDTPEVINGADEGKSGGSKRRHESARGRGKKRVKV